MVVHWKHTLWYTGVFFLVFFSQKTDDSWHIWLRQQGWHDSTRRPHSTTKPRNSKKSDLRYNIALFILLFCAVSFLLCSPTSSLSLLLSLVLSPSPLSSLFRSAANRCVPRSNGLAQQCCSISCQSHVLVSLIYITPVRSDIPYFPSHNSPDHGVRPSSFPNRAPRITPDNIGCFIFIAIWQNCWDLPRRNPHCSWWFSCCWVSSSVHSLANREVSRSKASVSQTRRPRKNKKSHIEVRIQIVWFVHPFLQHKPARYWDTGCASCSLGVETWVEAEVGVRFSTGTTRVNAVRGS